MASDSYPPFPSGDRARDERLLDRFFAGECTVEERVAVDAWIEKNPTMRRRVEVLRHTARYPDAVLATPNPAALWSSFETKIHSRVGHVGRRAIQPRSSGRWQLAGLAFVGVIALLAGTLLHEGSTSPLKSRQESSRYATASGQQATVTLSSGAKVVLGPATTLTVESQRDDADVMVIVDGQALFTVAHKNDKAFVVRAGNAVARVLGTTFMVRHYDADRVARIVVTEGRVSLGRVDDVSTAGTTAVLALDMLGTVDDSGHVVVTSGIAAEDYITWTKGQLVFRETPVRDIVVELARAYGTDIRVTDSALAERAFTWTVPVANQPLTGVLGALTEALGAHVVEDHSTITIVPGPVASRKTVGPRSNSQSEIQYGK